MLFITYYQVPQQEHGLPQFQRRWFSPFSGSKYTGLGHMVETNLRNSIVVRKRYESTSAAVDTSNAQLEKFEYQAEVFCNCNHYIIYKQQWALGQLSYMLYRDLYFWQVSRLMDLIVHSLYSNKEVFLRELVRWVA